MSNEDVINPKSVIHGVELRADLAMVGLQTALPASVTQLAVGGVVYTLPDLIVALQGAIKPWKDAREAHAVIRAVMASRPEDLQRLAQFLSDLKDALRSVLGSRNEALTQFGIKPKRSRKPLSTEKQAIAKAKAKLTRAKRGTLGRRQREALGKAETPTIEIGPNGVTITPAEPPASTDQQASAEKPSS